MDAFGLIGGIFSTSGAFPQIIQMIETKDTKALSWGMLFLWTVGLIMILIYAFSKMLIPVIIPNMIALTTTLIMISLKFKYENIKK